MCNGARRIDCTSKRKVKSKSMHIRFIRYASHNCTFSINQLIKCTTKQWTPIGNHKLCIFRNEMIWLRSPYIALLVCVVWSKGSEKHPAHNLSIDAAKLVYFSVSRSLGFASHSFRHSILIPHQCATAPRSLPFLFNRWVCALMRVKYVICSWHRKKKEIIQRKSK